MNNEKLVHLLSGGNLYSKNCDEIVNCTEYEVYHERSTHIQDIRVWLKENNLDDWSIEKLEPKKVTLYRHLLKSELGNWSIEPLITKPKTVTLYKYLVKDISGSVSETIFTSLSFDDYFEDYLINFDEAPELLKTETKQVEL